MAVDYERVEHGATPPLHPCGGSKLELSMDASDREPDRGSRGCWIGRRSCRGSFVSPKLPEQTWRGARVTD
jgi:hypothetical protein